MASNRNMGAVEILFDGASGQYIPQRFAEECIGPQWHNVSEDDRAILAAGPEHDSYWDVWSDVIDYAEFHADDGSVYRLYQDGDVFVYCYDRMTPEEQINMFGEYNPPDGTEVFYILDCFASAIEYGETDDLSDDEIEACEKFLADYPAPRYIVSVETAISKGFGTCEITGVKGSLSGVLISDREHVRLTTQGK